VLADGMMAAVADHVLSLLKPNVRTMAYLRLDKDNNFDSDWKHEMKLVSEGMADMDYCKKMEVEAPVTANYLVEHGVKLNHHQEKNVLLEFNTDQYFAFPEGGGNAIINCLFSHFTQYEGFDMYWETQAQKLLLNDVGEVSGVQARKNDGRRTNIMGKKVMLACGGFEGNKEMLARYVGPKTEKLELIAPGVRTLAFKFPTPFCSHLIHETSSANTAAARPQHRPRPPNGARSRRRNSGLAQRHPLRTRRPPRQEARRRDLGPPLRHRRKRRLQTLLRRRQAPPLRHLRNDRPRVLA